MALALDSGSVHSYTSSTQNGSVTFSTAGTNEVCVLIFICSETGDTPSVTSNTLSWTQRANHNGQLFEYYAIASSAVTNEAVSINTNNGSTFIQEGVVFAVQGANTTTPFDSGGSSNVPVSLSTYPMSIITNNANTFIYAFYQATTDNIGGAGWSKIYWTQFSTDFIAEYQILTSSGTNSATLSNPGSGGSNVFNGLADAIVAAGATDVLMAQILL